MSEILSEINKKIEELHAHGNIQEIPPLLEEAAELTRSEFGEESGQYAAVLNDLGGLYRGLGDY